MITIETIQAHHVNAAKNVLYQCIREFWRQDSPMEEVRNWAESQGMVGDIDNYQSAYFDSGGTFLIMLDGDSVIGMGAIKRFEGEICELGRMWILQQYRRQGLGSRVARKLLDFAKESGYRTVRLGTVSDLQGAINFYEKLGFRRIPRYRESHYSDVFMEKTL